MVNVSVCRLAEDPRFKIKVRFDKETNKIIYFNIMTGEECESLDLVLLSTNIGNEINDKWRYLIECVNHDKRLCYKISKGMNIIEY